MKNYLRLLILLSVSHSNYLRAQTSPQLLSSTGADTWTATDALGRNLLPAKPGSAIRKDRYVGIFYFVWHGAHGYDNNIPTRPDEGVGEKLPTDTASPYDISRLLAVDSLHPAYGPSHATHYWGEPHFGYYLSDDEYIMRKHAQMLSDAGVDLIILDVTNAAIYLPQVTKLMTTWAALRQQGQSTPAFAFIANTAPKETVDRLYANIYAKNLFKDLWFYWKGKPLLLCPPEALSDTTRNFFNTRHSWAWSKDQAWFADGKDKWPWLDHTPQNYGWHATKDQPEEISVALAEHPISNIGRSFHDGKEPVTPSPGKGLYFAEQWKRAIQIDPELVFVTGWNEWVAMRFVARSPNTMLGHPIRPGDSYFVDEYDEEYSRDAEPVNGTIKDNYYYQLINGIRQYKGSRPSPVATRNYTVQIDGKFADWQSVSPGYLDDAGDTFHRDHTGYGRIRSYTNSTGRNDIILAKTAAGKNTISFYVQTAGHLTPSTDSNWMVLYIGTGDTTRPAWEGFQYRVNRQRTPEGRAIIEACTGGWKWQPVGEAPMALTANQIELSINKTTLGIAGDHCVIDFKWTDNIPATGDPMDWIDKGDVAPNGRFRYHFLR